MNKCEYVPCLRWKQGEYQAVMRLAPAVKRRIMPLIEIPELGYDFEKRCFSKSIEEHCGLVCTRIRQKWGQALCLVDLKHVLPHLNPSLARKCFSMLDTEGCNAVPVVYLTTASSIRKELFKQAIRKKCLGIRLATEEFVDDDVKANLDTLLKASGIGVSQCDIILDLGAPDTFRPLKRMSELLVGAIARFPYLNEWRSVVLMATSAPQTMAALPKGVHDRPRDEWQLYRKVARRLYASGSRVPIFGDYATTHPIQPSTTEMDFRLIKTAARLKYTTADSWYVAKGDNVRDHGFTQYVGICKEVVKSPMYKGSGFSAGDAYIAECAGGRCSTGTLTTWVWVSTNHHITMVASDIANVCVT